MSPRSAIRSSDKATTPLEGDFNVLLRNSEMLVSSMQTFFKRLDRSAASEFEAINGYIEKTRDEIAALSPMSLTQKRLPSAGAELDAVVKDTEAATFRIMSAAETLLDYAGADPNRAVVAEQAMAILEACSFQDLAGQRLSKVTSLLALIETRVTRLITELKVTNEAPDEGDADLRAADPLLNGPAIGGPETSQDEIDALFD